MQNQAAMPEAGSGDHADEVSIESDETTDTDDVPLLIATCDS